MSEENAIFDLSNPLWKIKGILSAIVDNEQMDNELDCPFPTPKKYVAEVMAIIWVDENEIWNWKMRIKFPSGNKQVCFGERGKDANETKCLHDIYRFPLREKHWFPNPKGTFEGLIEVMKENDLIESVEFKVMNENV